MSAWTTQDAETQGAPAAIATMGPLRLQPLLRGGKPSKPAERSPTKIATRRQATNAHKRPATRCKGTSQQHRHPREASKPELDGVWPTCHPSRERASKRQRRTSYDYKNNRKRYKAKREQCGARQACRGHQQLSLYKERTTHDETCCKNARKNNSKAQCAQHTHPTGWSGASADGPVHHNSVRPRIRRPKPAYNETGDMGFKVCGKAPTNMSHNNTGSR